MNKINKLLFCIFVIIFLACPAASADSPKDNGPFEKVLDWVTSLYHKFFPEKGKTEIIAGKSIQPEEPAAVDMENETPAIAQETIQNMQEVSPPAAVPPVAFVAEESQNLGVEKEQPKAEEKDDPAAKKILLKSRQFVPDKGISAALRARINKMDVADKKIIHVLMQFEDTVDKEKREELENGGVKLLAYIPNKAWYASIPANKADDIISDSFVRSMDMITTDDKISPYIREDKIGSWAIRNGFVALVVEFHEDVNLDEAERIVKGLNGEVHSRIEILNALVVMVPKGMVSKLAEDDSVQWIEEIPPAPKLELDQSRPMIGGDTVQAAPYNLNGTGVKVLIYDGGQIDNEHPDLTGRVTNAEIWTESDHTTHVAGIVGGNGTLSNGKLRGIAPSVTMIAYDNLDYWYNDTDASIIDPDSVETEYYEAINIYGVDIATNSWGYPAALDGHCEREGDYDIASELFDNIVKGSMGKKISVVFSEGNERQQGCGEFGTTNPPHAAKNIIAVGAVNSDDKSMTLFSSYGPVDDGRIKPDLVAPGCEAEGIGGRGINSTIAGWFVTGGYDTMCGTSMAAPHVTGAIALIYQQYKNAYGAYPSLPSTTKALLIHTADNNVANSGKPDYESGYGLVNVTKVIDMIKYGSPVEIQTGYLLTGYGTTYYINSSGLSEIKATLVWDDPAGQPFAAKELVNNLDLVLIDPSDVEHYPWKLDPANPSAPATTGVDDLNNVEQVYISNPQEGIWKIVVKGTSVAVGIQSYSLVSDALLNQTAPPLPPTGPLRIVNMQHSAESVMKVRTVQRFGQLASINQQDKSNSTLKIRIIDRFEQLSITNAQHMGNSTLKVRIFSKPVIDGIPDQNLTEDSGLNDNLIDLWFYAYDNETADSSLNYTITLQMNASVVNCSIDSNRYIDCITQANQSGYSDITVKVANPFGLTDNDTFRVNVAEVNDPPWISPIIPDQNKNQNDPPWQLDLGNYENDVEDTDLSLDWSVSGVNTSLFTTSFDASLNNIIFMPVANACGSDVITLTLMDSNSSTALQDIIVILNCVNVIPTDDLYINSDTTLAPGTYNINDANNDGVIIINASNIVFDCNGAEMIGSGSGQGIYGTGGIDTQLIMEATDNLNNPIPLLENLDLFFSMTNFTENVTIKNCYIINYENAINISAFKNLELKNNILHDNTNGINYFFTYLSNTHNNDIYNNKKGIYSIALNSTINSNNAYNNEEMGIGTGGIYNDDHNNNAYGNGAGMIIIGFWNKVHNNNASGNGLQSNGLKYGIGIIGGNGTEIFSNIVSNNSKGGIGMANTADVKIYNNIVESNEQGISLGGFLQGGTSYLINISNNTINYNSKAGIVFADATMESMLRQFMTGTVAGAGHSIVDSNIKNNNLNNTGEAYDLYMADGTGAHITYNNITQNNFNGKGVYDAYPGNNVYCIDGVGNSYAIDATIAPGDCP